MIRKCEVCSLDEFKYRCPKCLVKYCSVACYKHHKAIQCMTKVKSSRLPSSLPNVAEAVEPGSQHETSQKYNSGDSLPRKLLERLGMSEDLLLLLDNPVLQKMLQGISSVPDPDEAIQKAAREPVFMDFAEACFDVVEPENDSSLGEDDKDGNENQARISDTTLQKEIPHRMLEKLGTSPEMLWLLENPRLQRLISAMDSSADPAQHMQQALMEPVFAHFAQECLNIVEPENDDYCASGFPEHMNSEDEMEGNTFEHLMTSTQADDFEESKDLAKEAQMTEDTVSRELLERLGHSQDVLMMLKNPHLQTMICDLDSTRNPEKAMQKAMREPIFTEFADACFSVLEPENDIIRTLGDSDFSDIET